MSEILLQGGRILDPATKRDVRADLLLKGGKVFAGKPSQDALVVKVDGLVVTPGWPKIAR